VKRICLASIASLPALVLAMATCAASASAAPADLDTSFGGDGIVEVEGPAGLTFPREAAARMAIGPRDEVFVLSSSYPGCEPPFDCTVELTVARYGADGSRDTAFAPGPQLIVAQNPFEHSFDLAVGADGKPVVAATDEGGGLVVARLGLDGRLDGGFGVGGRAEHTGTHAIESVRGAPALAVQPDGMVLVAAQGSQNEETQTSELLLARYLSTGQLDPGFGTGGETTLTLRGRSRPNAVLPGPAGTIAVPAPQCCVGSSGRILGGGFNVTRFLSNGQPDPGWPGGGALFYPVAPGYDGGIEAATIGPDGKLIVSVEENSELRSTVGNLVRFMPDGSLDSSFGEGGRTTAFSRVGGVDPDDLVVDPTGRIVGVGWAGTVSVFRLRPEGGADRTFNGGQHLVVPYGSDKSTPYQVGLQSGGRIVVLGESGNVGRPKGFALIGIKGGTDRTKCLGKRATIVGTANQDEIVGTPRRDVIAALGGKDNVRALGGADLICGGKGRDTLLGGPGKDRVQQDPVRRRSR
jgi:uncharacterized delta-60 repeat protein